MLVEKILFWLDAGFTQFGIAKFLQNIVDGEFFAIIDTNEGKEFFKNQKFVDFRKIWFYRDCLTLNKKTSLPVLVRRSVGKYPVQRGLRPASKCRQ